MSKKQAYYKNKYNHLQKIDSVFFNNRRCFQILEYIIICFFCLQIFTLKAALPLSSEYDISSSGPDYVFTENIGRVNYSTYDEMNGRNKSINIQSFHMDNASWGASSDGKAYGIMLGNDVVLQIQGTVSYELTTSVSNTYYRWFDLIFSGTRLPYTNRIDSNMGGGLDSVMFYPSPGIGNAFWSLGTTDHMVGGGAYPSYPKRRTNSNLKSSLYIGPKALSKTMYISSALTLKLIDDSVVDLINSGTIITIKNIAFECTVSAPPTIDFGQVPAKGDGWVPIASRDSTLQINCNSDYANASTPATISFAASPLYYGRSEILEMTTDGSNGVGILNGRYGQGNISNCSPNNSDNADAVKFDGTVSKTLDLNVGTNEVPITWTVCRRGDVQLYGDVSAQVTANINWD